MVQYRFHISSHSALFCNIFAMSNFITCFIQFAFLKNTSVGTFGYSMPGLNIEDSKAVSDQLTQCNQYGNPSVICIDEYTHFDADFDGQSFHFDFREKGRYVTCRQVKYYIQYKPRLQYDCVLYEVCYIVLSHTKCLWWIFYNF